MRFAVLASDCDGTLCRGKAVARATVRVLERLRASGRKLLLVTGETEEQVGCFPRAGQAAVFALTQDYGRLLLWDPFLTEARLLGGAAEPAVGVRAWCVAWYGMGMETEYVAYAPPRLAAVRMTRGPAALAAFAGSWRFEEDGPGATRVAFRYHLKAWPRWLRPLLDPLLAAVFAQDTRARLRALKRVAEAAVAQAPARAGPRRCRPG